MPRREGEVFRFGTAILSLQIDRHFWIASAQTINTELRAAALREHKVTRLGCARSSPKRRKPLGRHPSL
jgi:hypothetical protein